jgi:hypothetical protein
MKLRDPVSLAAVVLAAAAATAIVLVLVAVILVGRYQAKQHAIRSPMILAAGVYHKPCTQIFKPLYPENTFTISTGQR